MSYCRFSSLNWMSDVYVYQGHAYITHVASRRRLFAPIPDLSYKFASFLKYKYDRGKGELVYPNKFYAFLSKFVWRFMALWNEHLHMRTLHMIPLVNINREHAGGYFEHSLAKDCAKNLKYLRSLGYRVPQYAIDALLQEKD